MTEKQKRERKAIALLVQQYRADIYKRSDDLNIPQSLVFDLADFLYENGVRT